MEKRTFTPEQLHYLRLLSSQYPTVQAAGTEIIRLQAILNLPKGTEHFMSDIHGEHEAFLHILNSASGEVKEKLEELFGNTMTQRDRNDLATLIYYPAAKLALVADENDNLEEWYRLTIHRLVLLCRHVSTKYTRSKVRSYMPQDYESILDELIHLAEEGGPRRDQYENIINTTIRIGQAADVIKAICTVIKRLVVDRLHIVGDIFDRGPGADIIMESLLEHHNVDIQWGNHDVLWMGAASGSRTLVATVLANSLRYNNLEVIETGYGISLRPLSVFADEVYRKCDVSRFQVKIAKEDEGSLTERDKLLCARMHKAITMILFKLEGQKILRNPCFGMEDRLLLDKVDYEKIRQIYRERFQSAGDFDFYFTGAFNVDSLRAFTEQYIAPLKGIKQREEYTDLNISPVKGKVENRFTRDMETPQACIVVMWTGETPYTMKQSIAVDALGTILSERYLKSIREEGSMAYSVGAYADLSYGLHDEYSMQVYCPVKPEKMDEALALMQQGIDDIAKKGVTDEELQKFKEFQLKDYADKQRSNKYWESLVMTKNYWNHDLQTGYEDSIRNLKSDDVKAFVNEVLLKQFNRCIVTMLPNDLTEK